MCPSSTVEIEGLCRACGWKTLIRNRRGQIVCTKAFCKDPWATDRMLNAPIERKRLPDVAGLRKTI